MFKLAHDQELLSKKKPQNPDEQIWQTDDTNLFGLTTYKEKFCWRNIFEYGKENNNLDK